MKCPHCGSENSIGTKHCVRCAKKMDISFDEVRGSVFEDDAMDRALKIQTLVLRAFLILLFCWLMLSIFRGIYRIPPIFSSRVAPVAAPPQILPPDRALAPEKKILSYTLPVDTIRQSIPGTKEQYIPRRVRAAYYTKKHGGGERIIQTVDRYRKWLMNTQDWNGAFIGDADWGRGVRYLSREGASALASAALARRGPGHLTKKEQRSYMRSVRYLKQETEKNLQKHTVFDKSFVLYALSLCMIHWDREEVEEIAQRTADELLADQKNSGGWSSPADGGATNTTASAFAVLALNTAKTAGLDIKFKTDPSEILNKIQDGKKKRIMKNVTETDDPDPLSSVSGLLLSGLLQAPLQNDVKLNTLNSLEKQKFDPWKSPEDPGPGLFYNWCASLAFQHYASGYWYEWADDFTEKALKNQHGNGTWKPASCFFTAKEEKAATLIHASLAALALESYWYRD